MLEAPPVVILIELVVLSFFVYAIVGFMQLRIIPVIICCVLLALWTLIGLVPITSLMLAGRRLLPEGKAGFLFTIFNALSLLFLVRPRFWIGRAEFQRQKDLADNHR